MEFVYFLLIFLIGLAAIFLLLKSISKEKYKFKNFKGILYVFLGMMIGLGSGLSIFFSIDKTKGWNPYGWWFLATFGGTIVGGILGVFIYNRRLKMDSGR